VAIFWLAYQTSDGVCVVLQEAPSLVHARMVTALAGLDGEMTFHEGHELDAKTARKVPSSAIGKCLSPKQAQAPLPKCTSPFLPMGRQPLSPVGQAQKPVAYVREKGDGAAHDPHPCEHLILAPFPAGHQMPTNRGGTPTSPACAIGPNASINKRACIM